MTEPPSLSRQLLNLLPPVAVRLLRDAGVIAERRGLPLWLVGGSARDLLLERPLLDLDLVVEGDAPQLASVLAQELGAEVVARSRFGTTRLQTQDVKLDLASSRRESYARPGALPTVQPGRLEEDLARRDFTINAMAATLGSAQFGHIIDPFGGQEDLARRRLRVLHPRSFADDATRILRAVRYETRLDFRMDARTERLARQGTPYLRTISGDRLRRELARTFQEPRPQAALARARDLGLFTEISPGLDWPDATHRAMEVWRAERCRTEPLLCMALLTASLSSGQRRALAERLNMPVRWRRVVQDTGTVRQRLPELGLPGIRPSGVFHLLAGLEPAAVQAWALLTPDEAVRGHLLAYWQRLRYVKSRLNGHDLTALGVPTGPRVGALLEELLAARLDGLVESRADEEEWVRRAQRRL